MMGAMRSSYAAKPKQESVARRPGENAAPSPIRAHVATRMPLFLNGKFTVGHPGDGSEAEADRLADRVMRMPAAGQPHKAAAAAEATPRAGTPLAHLGAGRPLDPATRGFFEPRFGANFGSVRVHAGSAAARCADSLHARAFTLGRDVVFAQGEWAPE